MSSVDCSGSSYCPPSDVKLWKWLKHAHTNFVTSSTAESIGYNTTLYNNEYDVSLDVVAPLPRGYENWSALLLVVMVIGGVVGNGLVCAAIAVERKLRNDTNYFLVSLAIADLFVSIVVMPCCIAQEFVGYWPFGLVVCNAWQISDVVMCTSSIMHMCTISMDRYAAIRDPLRRRVERRTPIVVRIAVVWLASAAIGSPLIGLGVIQPDQVLNEELQCAIVNEYFIIYGSLAAFFGPLGIMLVTFALTVRLLEKQGRLCILTTAGGNGIRRCKPERVRPQSRGGSWRFGDRLRRKSFGLLPYPSGIVSTDREAAPVASTSFAQSMERRYRHTLRRMIATGAGSLIKRRTEAAGSATQGTAGNNSGGDTLELNVTTTSSRLMTTTVVSSAAGSRTSDNEVKVNMQPAAETPVQDKSRDSVFYSEVNDNDVDRTNEKMPLHDGSAEVSSWTKEKRRSIQLNSGSGDSIPGNGEHLDELEQKSEIDSPFLLRLQKSGSLQSQSAVVRPPHCVDEEVVRPPHCVDEEVVRPPHCVDEEVVRPPHCVDEEVFLSILTPADQPPLSTEQPQQSINFLTVDDDVLPADRLPLTPLKRKSFSMQEPGLCSLLAMGSDETGGASHTSMAEVIKPTAGLTRRRGPRAFRSKLREFASYVLRRTRSSLTEAGRHKMRAVPLLLNPLDVPANVTYSFQDGINKQLNSSQIDDDENDDELSSWGSISDGLDGDERRQGDGCSSTSSDLPPLTPVDKDSSMARQQPSTSSACLEQAWKSPDCNTFENSVFISHEKKSSHELLPKATEIHHKSTEDAPKYTSDNKHSFRPSSLVKGFGENTSSSDHSWIERGNDASHFYDELPILSYTSAELSSAAMQKIEKTETPETVDCCWSYRHLKKGRFPARVVDKRRKFQRRVASNEDTRGVLPICSLSCSKYWSLDECNSPQIESSFKTGGQALATTLSVCRCATDLCSTLHQSDRTTPTKNAVCKQLSADSALKFPLLRRITRYRQQSDGKISSKVAGGNRIGGAGLPLCRTVSDGQARHHYVSNENRTMELPIRVNVIAGSPELNRHSFSAVKPQPSLLQEPLCAGSSLVTAAAETDVNKINSSAADSTSSLSVSFNSISDYSFDMRMTSANQCDVAAARQREIPDTDSRQLVFGGNQRWTSSQNSDSETGGCGNPAPVKRTFLGSPKQPSPFMQSRDGKMASRRPLRLDTSGAAGNGPNLADGRVRFKSLVKKHGAAFKVAGLLRETRETQQMKIVSSVNTERKAVKVLGTMFAIFFACWAPFFTANLVMGLCHYCNVNDAMFKVFLWFGYASCTLNPVVYTIFNREFKATFCRLLGLHGGRPCGCGGGGCRSSEAAARLSRLQMLARQNPNLVNGTAALALRAARQRRILAMATVSTTEEQSAPEVLQGLLEQRQPSRDDQQTGGGGATESTSSRGESKL